MLYFKLYAKLGKKTQNWQRNNPLRKHSTATLT